LPWFATLRATFIQSNGASGFNIIRKLETGEEPFVAWREDIEQARRFVDDLNECWPAEYRIEENSSLAPKKPPSCQKNNKEKF